MSNKKDVLGKLWEQYATALGDRIVDASTGRSRKLSLRGERLVCALSQAELAERLTLECAKLQLEQREARLSLQGLRSRGDSFWARVAQLHTESTQQLHELTLTRQLRLKEIEVDCLQPLTACNAELRISLGAKRTEHEERMVRLSRRREETEGDLVWRVFCHSLEHEQSNTISVTPLHHDHVQVLDAVVVGQMEASLPTGESTTWRVVRAASLTVPKAASSAQGPLPSAVSGTSSSGACPPGSPSTQPTSARATRNLSGLVCSELIVSRDELHGLLEKMTAAVVNGKEGEDAKPLR